MKRQVRRGVFETNSSSVHSITMCTKSDYDKWKNGELVFNKWGEELVPITDEIKKSMDADDKIYLTYDQFDDWEYLDYETFCDSMTTPGGEEIIVFGYHGYDG